MTGTLLQSGDDIDVVVTSAKPFGLFIESDAGMSGLVRGRSAAVGPAPTRDRVRRSRTAIQRRAPLLTASARSAFSALAKLSHAPNIATITKPGRPTAIGSAI